MPQILRRRKGGGDDVRVVVELCLAVTCDGWSSSGRRMSRKKGVLRVVVMAHVKEKRDGEWLVLTMISRRCCWQNGQRQLKKWV